MIERAPMMEAAPETESAETAEIPLSLVGGQKLNVGDTVRLKVTSVDDENGMFSVEYAYNTPQKQGGIKEAAAQFDKGANYG